MFMSFMARSRLFLRLLAMAMTLSILSACGGSGDSKDSDSGDQTNEETNTNEPADDLLVGLAVELTSGGGVEGQVNTYKGKEYLGIPYAKAPIGNLRFVAPVAKGTVGDSFSAKAFGDACIQPAGLGKPTNVSFSEDCLSLNVYIPETVNKDSALPIMVFIHGGSLVNGGSSTVDGGRLAQEQDVIVVSINYRLGALGFLSLAGLDTEMAPEFSGNVGFMDQQLALTWVQDNIGSFGGDNNKVTVFGESAGSTSTCMHIVSPDSQDLAHQFILESGICTRDDGLLSNSDALDRSNWVVSTATGTDCSGGTDADELACLRALDASVFAINTEGGLGGWNAVVRPGSSVMPEFPKTTINSATGFNTGPVILGFNKDEWDLFSYADPAITEATYLEATFNATIDIAFSDATDRTNIKTHYGPGADGQAAYDALNDVFTDYAFRCPTRNLTRQLESTNDVWLYSFDQGLAWHSFELPYVFGTPPLSGSLVESVRVAMQDAWGEFARTGSPGSSWTKYNTADDKRMSFVDASPGMIADVQAQSELCDFWGGI